MDQKETPKKEKEEQKKVDAKPETKEQPAPNAEAAPLKGIVGTKVGMTQIFVDDTTQVPVTVISSEGVLVSQVKTIEKDGYNAVQIAYEDVPERKLSKAEAQHFIKNKLSPKRHICEFRVNDTTGYTVGQPVPVSNFAKGDWILASGFTKGKGFTGTIKRFGFGGGPHSHGHGEYRRSPGSSGGQGPQHVLPGTRKPGHKGDVWQTVKNIQVADIVPEKNLILLRGSVPGRNGGFVVLRPSQHKKIVAQPTQGKGKKK